MNLLNRVQRVLGITPTVKSNRPLLAGLLALGVPAVLWLAMFTVAPTAVPAEEHKDQATGTVADDQGMPEAGLKIQVFENGKMIRELSTDSHGQFKVPMAWRSNQLIERMLIVQDKERLAWFRFFRHPSDAAKNPDFRMVMVPLTRQVHGVLVDESGHPLPDFPVGVESLSHDINGLFFTPYLGDEPFLPIAKTDATGRFKITLPTTDLAWLRLYHRDRLALRLLVAEGKTDLGKISVGEAGRIEGRVTDGKTGKPLASAWIDVDYLGSDYVYRRTYGRAKSDQDGRFVIGGLLPGQYDASFSSFNQNPKLVAAAKKGIVVEAGKTVTADFQASEGRRLAGKLIDVVSGKPLPRFTVFCSEGQTVLTDDQGRFEFYVSPGPCRVYVDQGPQMRLYDSIRTVEVLPDRDITELVLQATTKDHANFNVLGGIGIAFEEQKKINENQDWLLRIRLRTPDGRQVNGVTYRWVRGGQVISSGVFAGNQYDFDGWGEHFKGIYSLLIDADGYKPVLTKEFEYKKRMEPVTVDLEPEVYVPVRGRVVDAEGRPLSGVRVRAGRIFIGQSKEFPWGVETTTDAQGQFELKRLRQGERLLLYADRKDVGGVESRRFLLEKKEPYQVGDLQIPRGPVA